MVNKSSKKPIKRENRVQAFCTFLSEMDTHEEAKITNIAKEIGVHVNSVKDMIDMYETIKDAAKIDIIRDKKDNIRRIVRVKEDSTQIAFKKEIRDAVVNINNRMDQVAEDTKEIKNKVEKNPK